MADDSTLIINPAWADEPRTTGLSNAACGITTDSKYAEEYVRAIAAAYETDGSVFLLWERRAEYADPKHGKRHTEDICGVTYVKKSGSSSACVIATFRQPSPDELQERFKPSHEVTIRPGSDNFFAGKRFSQDTPVAEQQMLAAVRSYYAAWQVGTDKLEDELSHIADPQLRINEPMWEGPGQYLPLNRVEAGMWMERWKKNLDGKLRYTPKAVAHAEGTNMVFALWFAEGMDSVETAGIHVFFFGDDLKIKSIAVFREPSANERKINLK